MCRFSLSGMAISINGHFRSSNRHCNTFKRKNVREKRMNKRIKRWEKRMKTENFKILKKWIIRNIEADLQNYTYPVIKKATEDNIKKAIKQNKHNEKEKGSGGYYELLNLKDDLKVFVILKEIYGRKE